MKLFKNGMATTMLGLTTPQRNIMLCVGEPFHRGILNNEGVNWRARAMCGTVNWSHAVHSELVIDNDVGTSHVVLALSIINNDK